MAAYDEGLAAFVAEFGEQSVVSALTAYKSARARQAKYAEKYAEVRKAKAAERKENNAFAKQLAVAAASGTDAAAKVKELLAARGINI